MKRLYKKSKKIAASSPGTLTYVGDARTEPIEISVLDYNESLFQEKIIQNIHEIKTFKNSPTFTWVNVSGVHDTQLIESIGKMFHFHPLILEDIVHTDQRPKLVDYDSYVFLVFKMLYFDSGQQKALSEQISIVFGDNYLISFQEKKGDIFQNIRHRIQHTQWRTKKLGVDYLAYTLLDAVVDYYFNVLEIFSDMIENTEQKLETAIHHSILEEVHYQKRELIFLRKSIWPIRDVVHQFQKSESSLISDKTQLYLKDVYDHTIHVMDTIESFRDLLSSLIDLYSTHASNKMNEIMKVLTITATIFIPPTLIAGIYGMNFEWMPELKWPIGYPLAIIIMLSMIISMLVFFKKKRWL